MNPYEKLVETNPYETLTETPRTPVERAGRVAGLGARAVVKGVSAIPTLMADAASELINAGAQTAGVGYRMQKPSAVLDRALSGVGLPAPETPVERISSAVTSAGAGMGSQLAALRSVASGAAGAPQAIAEQLTQMPGRQMAGAGIGAGASSGVGEMGGGPVAQTAAGIAGSMIPFAPAMIRGARPLTPTEQVARESHQAGYAIPPTQVRPNLVNRALEGVSGKITTAQQASAKNQAVTNRLAAESLGLPPDTVITPSVLERVRSQAGMAYGKIKMLPGRFNVDAQFRADVRNLGKDFSVAAREFPEIASNKFIDDLQAGLSKPDMSPQAAVELVKKLRFDATKNFKASDDPARAALAGAQRQAADAIEGLIERSVTAMNRPELVRDFRSARQLIAKTYDVETALNETTGTVSARAIGNLTNRKPVTGQLETIGRFSNAFPKAAQVPEAMGSLPGISPLDFYGGIGLGMGGYALGSPALAALSLARPAIRAGILSPPYQAAIIPSAPMPRDQAMALGLLSSLQTRQ